MKIKWKTYRFDSKKVFNRKNVQKIINNFHKQKRDVTLIT